MADSTFALSSKIDNITLLEYEATPPKLPVNFEVADIPYIGEMKWKIYSGSTLDWILTQNLY